jgi:hypothetical protein
MFCREKPAFLQDWFYTSTLNKQQCTTAQDQAAGLNDSTHF